MTPLGRLCAAAAVTITVAAGLSGCGGGTSTDGGQPLDLDNTSCSDWAAASDTTKALNAEATVLVFRRSGKVQPEEPTDDQIDGMVSDIDDGCGSSPGSTAGTVAASAVLNRSDFYLG